MAKTQAKPPVRGKALLPAGQHEGILVTGEMWVPATENQYEKAIRFVPYDNQPSEG